ncbi:MAG: hypothetical protein WC761_05255 [Candidatus Paceibacterota bacterium]|jgi:hypothetical protein
MVTTIIFFLSLLGIIFLFWNKQRELTKGQALVRLTFGSDVHLKQKIENARLGAKDFPKRAMNIGAFYAVKHGLNAFEKTKQVVYPRIAHIVDAVKGRDIPRNRGSVSLFLKHIEEHQKNISRS